MLRVGIIPPNKLASVMLCFVDVVGNKIIKICGTFSPGTYRPVDTD